MAFYMFLHRLSSDGLSPAEMTGALKYDKGSVSVSGTKKLIDNYKRILDSGAWLSAKQGENNPFSEMFGSSMVPRYVFSEGEKGEAIYNDFLGSSSSLVTEVIE
jgi:hypothetical protein